MARNYRTTVRHFFEVIERRTWGVVSLAVISTFVCLHFGWQADVPAGLIGLAVVFPIVFSINAAYRRREEVLRYFGGVKACAVALYYAHRDWPPIADTAEHTDRNQELMKKLLEAISDHFTDGVGRTQDSFERVYAIYSQISQSHETLREAGVSNGEISRLNQYLAKSMFDFEKMNNILMYRTPNSLRAYSTMFLNLFPILFAPYFANLAHESYPMVGYAVAVIYSLVLVTLDNVQDDLEDPFDRVGTDDVNLAVLDQYLLILE